MINKKILAKEIKRANTRLVALEKKGLADTSRAYQYVFSEMPNRYELTGVSKSGHLKFTTKLSKLSESDLKTLKAEVSNFLKAKTSTVRGARTVEKNRQENFRKQFGSTTAKRYKESKSFKKTVDNALKSEAFKNTFERFGSDQTMTIIKEYGWNGAEKVFAKALSTNIETLTELYEIIEELEND